MESMANVVELQGGRGTACRTIARRAQKVLQGTSCIVGGRVAVGQAVHKRAASYRAAICSAIGPAIRLLPRKLSFWVRVRDGIAPAGPLPQVNDSRAFSFGERPGRHGPQQDIATSGLQ